MVQRRAVIHAYRHLYRDALRAVMYSSPARHTARDQLRRAFREDADKTLDVEGVKRTGWFLKGAAKEAGREHQVLKNLLMVAWHREDEAKRFWRAGMKSVETRHHKGVA